MFKPKDKVEIIGGPFIGDVGVVQSNTLIEDANFYGVYILKKNIIVWYGEHELMPVQETAGSTPATGSIDETNLGGLYNMPSFNSTSLVGATPSAPVTTKRRGDLVVGDLFRNVDGGKIYMHTGSRTRPPSGSGDVVSVNGKTVYDGRPATLGRNAAGRDIIGYQAIVVRGSVTAGEDGAVVTFDGSKNVVYLGRASIALPAGV